MCLSVVRNDPRFRLTMTGNVGLSEWEDVRVPSRLAVIQSSLEKSDGRVSVEAVQARLAAIYGSPSDRNYIGMMANRFGGGIDGDWVYGDGNGQTVDC